MDFADARCASDVQQAVQSSRTAAAAQYMSPLLLGPTLPAAHLVLGNPVELAAIGVNDEDRQVGREPYRCQLRTACRPCRQGGSRAS